ncbi:MAG: hypothetical protein QNJ55_25645 [Xenococcus sp. MO_188.B8]|nr:hypothetical protein [Xenococcus sp. MO_188.B8]
MDHVSTALMTDEEWINQGKADAWAGKSKQIPEHDPQAASMYDLGYCEGEIERSPCKTEVTQIDHKQSQSF